MSKFLGHESVTRGRVAALGVVALLVVGAVGCGSTSDGDSASTTLSVADAQRAFCGDLASGVAVLDRYGQIFSDEQVTIGDLQDAAADVEQTRSALEESGNGLADAIAATNEAAEAAAGTTTTVLASKSADDHLSAIDKAEKELGRTVEGVESDTTVSEASAEVQAAAFGVEQAYVSLFVDAGCLEDDAQAARLLNSYTTALQEDLTTLGFYTSSIDGLYGPGTVTAVKALQASAGLPQTGIVDPATEAELSDQLDAREQQESLNIAALQGALSAAGSYTGPIDGTWTPALEAALKDYQTAQNLPATGAIDPATLAALLSGGLQPPSATTTSSTVDASTSSTTP